MVMNYEEEDDICPECDGVGYTYDGGFSFNESMNVRIPCTNCESDGYDDLDDRLKR